MGEDADQQLHFRWSVAFGRRIVAYYYNGEVCATIRNIIIEVKCEMKIIVLIYLYFRLVRRWMVHFAPQFSGPSSMDLVSSIGDSRTT